MMVASNETWSLLVSLRPRSCFGGGQHTMNIVSARPRVSAASLHPLRYGSESVGSCREMTSIDGDVDMVSVLSASPPVNPSVLCFSGRDIMCSI